MCILTKEVAHARIAYVSAETTEMASFSKNKNRSRKVNGKECISAENPLTINPCIPCMPCPCACCVDGVPCNCMAAIDYVELIGIISKIGVTCFKKKGKEMRMSTARRSFPSPIASFALVLPNTLDGMSLLHYDLYIPVNQILADFRRQFRVKPKPKPRLAFSVLIVE